MRTVVIGSGIVGASAAHHLARAGVDVVVVDQGHPGKATRAGAGIVCPWASAMDDGPLFELYAAGAASYEAIVAGLGRGADADIGYRRVGALVVSEDRDELDAAEARLARRSVGRPEVGDVDRVDNREARSRFPPLRTGVEAIAISGGARVDGRLLADTLLSSAGAERVVAPALAALTVVGDRVTGVRIGDEEVPADRVVVAAGAWTPALLEPLGLATTIDVEPQKGQIVHLGLDADTSRWPVLLPVGPHYLLAFDDSRVVVGATRETGSGFDVRVTAAGQAEVLATALSVAPGLADATIIETRVGLRPLANGLPTIGPVPGLDGLVVGTGLGAAGLTIGPLCGRVLADLVLGREPAIDPTPFLPGPRSPGP
jgi:D-amino-acid dehydrogenase